jgi:hypothetical protein
MTDVLNALQVRDPQQMIRLILGQPGDGVSVCNIHGGNNVADDDDDDDDDGNDSDENSNDGDTSASQTSADRSTHCGPVCTINVSD